MLSLKKKISFLQILNIVEKIVIDHRPIKTYNLNQITTIYQQAEKLTLNLLYLNIYYYFHDNNCFSINYKFFNICT